VGLTTLLPFGTFIVTLLFALAVLQRYLARRGSYLLLWGIGLLMYDLGAFCEFYVGATRSWNETLFRLWYLCGALLVAAWLGQGTVALLASKRVARVSLVMLVLASIFGAFAVFFAPLDASGFVAGAQLTAVGVVPKEVRMLTPFFNVYGVVALVGGALYSAWIFWRKRILMNRLVGNVFIAAGALMPTLGGTLSRFGLSDYLYLGEFAGAVLMFAGFWLAISTVEARRRLEAAQRP